MTDYTPEMQDDLRKRVRDIMARDSLKMTDVASGTGVPYGTIAAWLAGTYAGKTEDKAEKVALWLDAREQKARVSMAMPAAPTFLETDSSARMLALFQYCQHAPDIGVIAGGAGIGKTTTAFEYQRRAPNVFIITAEPVMTSASNFLVELATIMSLPEGTPIRMSRAISRKLYNANALIIVDEAQHLSTSTLNQARALHDASKCGLVFVGNETVYGRMGDGRAEFAQLFSRVGMKHTQTRPREEDVRALLKAWGLGIDERLPLAIAKKPGALRGLTKCIRLAHVLANGEGAAHVEEKHLRSAWDQIGFDRIEVA